MAAMQTIQDPTALFEMELYRKMLLIRLFEEKALQLYSRSLIRGSTHMYIGQEAVAVGICGALDVSKGDAITSHHRGHGHFIAMGGDVKRMMAELLGKATGYCHGKGGSMHIADRDLGVYGANGIVGGGIAMGCGLALGAVLRREPSVAVTFFGDGAANEGILYESLNLASIWDLPVLFVCENNQYAQTTPAAEMLAGGSVARRADGFNVEGIELDGNDLETVYATAKTKIDEMRTLHRPVLIEAKTYRWRGHWQGDPEVYRSKDEVLSWMKKCPIARFAEHLTTEHGIAKDALETVENEVVATIEDAEAFALASAEPDVNTLLDDIYTSNGREN